MRIRYQTEIPATSPTYYRAMIQDALDELAEQHRSGEIDQTAYLAEKRSLEEML